MSALADRYLYDETLESGHPSPSPTLTKNVLWIPDQQNGAYNGIIVFDSTQIANGSKWMSLSESFVQVPYVVTLSSSADQTAVINSFSMGLKNGYYQIFDSIAVEYNGTSVVQQTPYVNHYVNYKVISTFSQDDVKKYGQTIGFALDSAGSVGWSAGASTSGNGTFNNLVTVASNAGALPFASQLQPYNEGFAKRCAMTNFPVTTANAGMNGNPAIATAGGCNIVGMSYLTDNAGVANLRVWNIHVLATIRLKDMCDFFAKMPLVKGGKVRITLTYNSGSTVITAVGGGGDISIANNPTMSSGRTFPVMVASASAVQPNAGLVAGTLTINCGVGTGVFNYVGTPQLSTCRLYIPCYELSAEYEKNLISLRPTRELAYDDIIQFSYVGVGTSTTFTANITAGLVRPKRLLMIPYLNNGLNQAATISLFPYQSPFDSCPGTTSPLCAVNNWQVAVSGTNMFNSALLYDFEEFLGEISEEGAINGGASTGLTSGLLSQQDWSLAYRYYVCDLSRRLPADDFTPKSIVVTGTNPTGKTLDLLFFVAYERRFKLNMIDGSIEQ